MSDIRSSITIDLIVKGLEKIEKIGAVLGSLVLNSKFTNGFNALYNALGSVSTGVQKALGSLGKFAVLISALSNNPQFKEFAQVTAEALRQINAELGGSVSRTKAAGDSWKKLSMALGIVSILIRSVGFLIRDLGLNMLRTSQRIGAFFKKLVDGGSEIEQKLSELQALLNFQSKEASGFKELTNEIVRVGEVSSQTISQVAGLANELARAGFNAKEITQSIASVVQLSEAAGLSAEQAATIAANVKTMFNLQASELSRVNDVLTQTANASTTSVQSLGESFTYVGPLASAFGFSVEEVAAALGVLANAGQRGCYDGETEVLTKGGWVRWDRVTGDETFATVNQKTNELEYHPALRNIKYRHTGKMYKVDLQNVDLLVTPNHNMYVQLRGDDEYCLIKAEDAFGKTFKYKTRVSYSGTRKDKFVLPGVPVFMGNRSETRPPIEINMDDWISFMGAYLSEGCVSEDDKGNYRIFISQYESSKGYEKFKEVIERLPFAFKYDGKRFICRDYQLYQHLKTYGKASQKFVPEEFFNLSKEQINLFLEFYRLGDGTKKEKHGRFVMTTVSPMMEQDLARLGVLSGYTVKTKSRQPRTSVMKDGRQVKGKHAQFEISFTSHQRYSNPVNNPLEVKRQSKFSGESWVDFDGFVYCVEVPNNTLIIRRNGKVIICGNSVAGAGLQQMFSQLISHSDKVDIALSKFGKSFQDVNPEIHSVTEIMKVFSEVNLSTADIIDIFSERARKTFLALQSQGQDTLELFIEMNQNAAGLAASIAETRMDNVSGDILRLKSALEALTFEAFNTIQSDVRNVVQEITRLIQATREYVSENKEFIRGLADAIAKFAAFSLGLAGLTLSLSTFTRVAGTFAGAAATMAAGWSLLVQPIYAWSKSIYEAAKYTSTAVKWFGVLNGIMAVTTKGVMAMAKGFGIFLLGFSTTTLILGIVAAGVLAVIYNWDLFSKTLNKFYYDTWLPIYYGFFHGFMEGYETYIKPAMAQFAEAFGSLFETISEQFGSGSDTYQGFSVFGKAVAFVAAGFVSLSTAVVRAFGLIVDGVRTAISAINWLWETISTGGENIVSNADIDGNPLVKPMESAAKVAAEYRHEMNLAIKAHNEFMRQMLDLGEGLDNLVPLYEKAASLLSRITELRPNELNEFKTTLEQIKEAGGDFTLEGIEEELSKLDGSGGAIEQLQANVDAWKKALDGKEWQKMIAQMGFEGGGPEARKAAEEMYNQNVKLLEDYIQKRNKLLSTKENFGMISLVTGAKDFEEFKSQRAQLKTEFQETEREVAEHKARLAQLRNTAAGFSGNREFKTDQERVAAIQTAQQELEKAQAKAKGILDTFQSMGQIGTEDMFNRIRSSMTDLHDPIGALIDAMTDYNIKQADAAEKAKAWADAQVELKETLKSSADMIQRLGRELEAAGLDPQSKQEFDIRIKTQDAVAGIDDLIAKFEDAEAKAKAAGIKDGVLPLVGQNEELARVQENLAKLRALRAQYAQHGADEENRIAQNAAQDRLNTIADIELEIAEEKKLRAKELFLTEQKYNQETEELMKEKFMDASTGRERDGAEAFRRARESQLQLELDAINEKYDKEDEENRKMREEKAAEAKKDEEDRARQILDIDLDLAQNKKDQAKEIALFQQKWNEDTARELKTQYTDEMGFKKKGYDEYEARRREQLQDEVDKINEKYLKEAQKANKDPEQKKPVDRAKEMVDIQNEAYQILLKKVQSTKDLFALERALLKIQEMQLANSLKMSSRAITAEFSVSKAQQRHDEALAKGEDPTKTGIALKKAQERAKILRGTSDLRNRQMGVGTSDVNAMNVARESMDLTTTAVIARIGEKLKLISDAMNGMTVTFSSIAETWIDAFVTSWDANSVRMQQAVLGTLSNLGLTLNMAALGGQLPQLSGAAAGGEAPPIAGAGSVINNFQVTALDPLEAGKKMARMIDQSTRDL